MAPGELMMDPLAERSALQAQRPIPGPKRDWAQALPSRTALTLLGLALFSCTDQSNSPLSETSEPFVMVLGTAQDGGLPQIACSKPCCQRVRQDRAAARMVTSLMVADPGSGQRWLLDAGPDLPRQVQLAARAAPRSPGPGRPPLFDGIFLTHAHMGHILGLLHLGRESYGAESQRVICTPSVARFLREEAPWSLLVDANHIVIEELQPGKVIQLNERLKAELIQVPHRGEFTDTVGIRIQGQNGSLLYLPDIDKWSRWERDLKEELAQVELAFLDATFYGDGELPGRPMSAVPHPFVVETLQELEAVAPSERAKVRLIHLNHTNPLHDPGAPEQAQVQSAGIGLAIQGQCLTLDGRPLD